ncbi:ferric/cupric-chelate reductase [Modicella reniformis]|uniref:Ferric/cupric-chelate reductase n=1 Tax=Modicella reniformis TaxID=1440133 RepID=A0A9P6LTB8_9FUNG|nr:ferric/cupric-chelate reductase [Modicella reniformis]
MKFRSVALSCVLVLTLYMFADFKVAWLSGVTVKDIYYYNKRDLYVVVLFIIPAIVSHLVTIWGHYFKRDEIFQESIAKCSTATVKERTRIPVWERHDPWWGFTVKYWLLVGVSVLLNVIWFAQPVIAYLPPSLKTLGTFGAVTRYVAYASGYAALGSCGMLLFLVLRRSMLQALGYTYADILPLHRWMGVAFIVWSTIHAFGYILYYVHANAFLSHFNFDGNTRGPQNMIALFAYAALLGLGVTAIPQVRRSCYLLFITTHRIFTVILFVGTIMHFPYYMLWYYILPSVCLYFADRFVPKFIQSCSMAREVECSFNKDADILTETKTSWTGTLTNLCQEKGDGEVVMLKANVDGVFGDRDHGYLSSKVMVIFAAGTAITTFMSLLKAMAAQIEFSAETMNYPATIEVYLICTFRYESELYAYGDFMHRITHDPRFTSWLHTEIYVTRQDKHAPPPECPSGQCISEFVCGRVEDEDQEAGDTNVNESTLLLARYNKKSWHGTLAGDCSGCGDEERKGCMGCSSGACSSSSASSITITAAPAISVCTQDSNAPKKVASPTASSSPSLYHYKSLPTFPQASSSAIAAVHAKKDLVATSIILIVPMIVFLLSRAIPWEGTYKGEDHWCRAIREKSQHMTNRCLWSYAVLPGTLHVLVASMLGYLGLWLARNTNLLQKHSPMPYSRSSYGYGSITAKATTTRGDVEANRTFATTSPSATSAYRNLLQGLGGILDPALPGILDPPLPINNIKPAEMTTTKGSIQFKHGRIQVGHHIQELKAIGIGREVGADGESMEAKRGGALVFGGGPDAFVDMIEESCKKARWDVDFHRETWAP